MDNIHVKEARVHGERELCLDHVAIGYGSPLFCARECTALAWTKVLTRLPNHRVSEANDLAVRAEFNEQEAAYLSFAIVGINGWNRLAIGFASAPGSQDQAYGLDKAGLT